MAYFDDAGTARAQQSFIRQSMQSPMLEKEVEWDLARRWQATRDPEALDRLIRAYIRLVITMAGKFKHYGLANSDLIQEGVLGLMQAANKFEPERELRFSTYATWWIRSHMQDYVLKNWSIVRSGSTAQRKSLFFNMRRMRAQLERKSSSGTLNAIDDEIAAAFKMKTQDVQEMFARFSGGDQSINIAVGEDGGAEIGDFMADDSANPEAAFMSQHDEQAHSDWVHHALNQLSPREKQIIIARRLMDEPRTLEDIGHEIGVSKERVRQLEVRALEKLRDTLTGMPVDLSEFGGQKNAGSGGHAA